MFSHYIMHKLANSAFKSSWKMYFIFFSFLFVAIYMNVNFLSERLNFLEQRRAIYPNWLTRTILKMISLYLMFAVQTKFFFSLLTYFEVKVFWFSHLFLLFISMKTWTESNSLSIYMYIHFYTLYIRFLAQYTTKNDKRQESKIVFLYYKEKKKKQEIHLCVKNF